MDVLNKDDLINVYILNTLNEIKKTVKENIKLDKDREDVTDKKMMVVLTDLINANFKNLQRDINGNIIYTFLPILDEKENEKVRSSLILYYVALYYDNVVLLQDLIRAGIKFNTGYYNFNLCYLDKSISSKFDRKEYIRLLNECGFVFTTFHKSLEDLSPVEREKYILRLKKLIKIKHEMLTKIYKKDYNSPITGVFTKNRLDAFSDETYICASIEQLIMIGCYGDKKISNEGKIKLNDLMQTKEFSNCLYNYDLMLRIFTDEELDSLDKYVSTAISKHYETDADLPKILDFVNRRPDLAYEISLVPAEKFRQIDNDTLIEICAYSDKNLEVYSLSNSKSCDLYAKKVKPKVVMKRVLGIYKR